MDPNFSDSPSTANPREAYQLGCPRREKVTAAPRELSFISQHSFVQKIILSKGAHGQHLHTEEGIGILGFCGKNYPFFFQKSHEGSHPYPLVTSWVDPYSHLSSTPAGPVFAGYVQGGWKNSTLAQWQHAHQNPVVLFLPQSFIINPQLDTLGFPLPGSKTAELTIKFLAGH